MHHNVLDHGYVKLIDVWGSDQRVIEAARMSVNKGFLGWGPKEDGKLGDERLLKYLYTHKHNTPFEMGGMTIEVQAPIFVMREWMRHRTQSYNEASARYEPLPDVNYVPTVERLMLNFDKGNKQAGTIAGAPPLTLEKATEFIQALELSYTQSQEIYDKSLREGVPKELARIHLPVGRYNRMRASANLRNWLGFLTLRMDPTAQLEIREYANVVADMVKASFPRTYELFANEQSG